MSVIRKILLFEDDEEITKLIEYALYREPSFKIVSYCDSDGPLEKVKKHNPDLIILDLNLPSVSGWDVIKIIRQDKTLPYIPVIMITGYYKSSCDIVHALESFQADDYITKPFSPDILLARAKSILRRTSGNARKITKNNDTLKLRKLTVNHETYEVKMDGQKIELTPTEFKILAYLLKRTPAVCTREELLESVHIDASDYFSRTIDRHITELRKKLDNYGEKIKTVTGVGYKIEK